MFITIEGIDGAGKSTQAKHLATWLEVISEVKTIRTFEPGGWEGGSALRKFILESKNLCAMSEFLLFMADRAEHLHSVILPELIAGNNVICERWNESTLAYQCGGRKIKAEYAKKIIEACSFPEPDVKILLKISPEVAFSRIKARKANDKFEEEGLEFMQKVAKFYAALAEEEPDKFIVIDCGEREEYEIAGELMRKLGVEIGI